MCTSVYSSLPSSSSSKKMDRTWVMDTRGIAKKVKSVHLPCENQIKDCGANRECPNCSYPINNNDASSEWPGFPVGVKFDPSDLQLVEHLAAKCGVGGMEPHEFIDEFIPTLEGIDGICCTHPENLPGARKDGNSIHFFHKTKNAYSTGQRKRRKIQSEQIRWHKTGKTKPIMDNGVQRGFKKIMVLYGTSVKGSKPCKSNWVMHQYHLGKDEDEKQGEIVVSKVFYQQPKQSEKVETPVKPEESDKDSITQFVPKTPNGKCISRRTDIDDFTLDSHYHPHTPYLAGESQGIDENEIYDSLLCDEDIKSYSPLTECNVPLSVLFGNSNEVHANTGKTEEGLGFSDLENILLDSAPDLTDLQFGSQDSMIGWMDGII